MKAARLMVALVAAFVVPLAAGQDYPGNKPIRLIVPFPAGGGTDIFARVIGNKLTETLKWVVVIDNKPGAGGNIGMATYAAEQIVGILKGGRPPRLINPDVWPAYSKRFEALMGARAQPEVQDLD